MIYAVKHNRRTEKVVCSPGRIHYAAQRIAGWDVHTNQHGFKFLVPRPYTVEPLMRVGEAKRARHFNNPNRAKRETAKKLLKSLAWV